MLSYFGICSRFSLCARQAQACTDGWNQTQGRALFLLTCPFSLVIIATCFWKCLYMYVSARHFTLIPHPHHWENSNDTTRLKECWGRCGWSFVCARDAIQFCACGCVSCKINGRCCQRCSQQVEKKTQENVSLSLFWLRWIKMGKLVSEATAVTLEQHINHAFLCMHCMYSFHLCNLRPGGYNGWRPVEQYRAENVTSDTYFSWDIKAGSRSHPVCGGGGM